MQSEVRRRGSHDAQRAPAGVDDPHAASAVRQGQRQSDQTHQRRADPPVDRLCELFESGSRAERR